MKFCIDAFLHYEQKRGNAKNMKNHSTVHVMKIWRLEPGNACGCGRQNGEKPTEHNFRQTVHLCCKFILLKCFSYPAIIAFGCGAAVMSQGGAREGIGILLCIGCGDYL